MAAGKVDGSDKLAKAQKKLSKAQAAGDEELIAKFTKKVKKLQKQSHATADAGPSPSPAKKKRAAEPETNGTQGKQQTAAMSCAGSSYMCWEQGT